MNMTNIKVLKNEIKRLSSFASFIKSFNSVAPLNEDKQIFMLDENNSKLEVYAEGNTICGGASSIRIILDVEVLNTQANSTLTYFVLSAAAFVNAASKIVDDEITISIDDALQNKLTFKGKLSSRVSLSPFIQRDLAEIQELLSFWQQEKSTNDFAASMAISLQNGFIEKLSQIASFTKVLDLTSDVYWDDNLLKSADKLCIVSSIIQNKAPKPVYIQRNLLSVLKDIDVLYLYGNNNRKVYFENSKTGIAAYSVMPDVRFEYPTEDELNYILPDDSNVVELEVNVKDLYEVLNAFDGIFDSSAWKYKQVRVRKEKDNPLHIYYDDLKAECHQFLPIKILKDTCTNNDFTFVIGTQHLTGSLEPIISSNDTIIMRFNSLSMNDEHGIAIEIRTEDTIIIIPKMNE